MAKKPLTVQERIGVLKTNADQAKLQRKAAIKRNNEPDRPAIGVVTENIGEHALTVISQEYGGVSALYYVYNGLMVGPEQFEELYALALEAQGK